MISKLVDEFERTKEFMKFKQEYPNTYLAHIFSMHTPNGTPEFQLGYCNKEQNKLIVFKLDPIEQLPPDKAFNDNKEIEPLDIGNVLITQEDAEKKALEFFSEKFSAETVTKVIMILQRLQQNLYNFTLVTMTFNICNIKIDAKSGELLSSEFKSIMSLRQSDN